MSAKLVVFSGSLRKDSYNKKLARICAKMAESAGAEVDFIDLNELSMPLYNEDMESTQGIDSNALLFKEKLNSADGFIITSPEYNGSYSGALKNAIDWASRQAEGESMLQSFRGKYAIILATSPGAFGGLRGLSQLRLLLSGLGTTLLADQIAIPKAQEAFHSKNDEFTSEKRAESVQKLVTRLISTIIKLK